MTQAQPRRTPQRGKWVILLLMGMILAFTVWKQFFTEREHSSQAEAAIEPLTAPIKPIQMPAEQEPLPPPKPLAPKPQAQSPRPQATAPPRQPQQKSEWQKELDKRRLAGAWARPVSEKQPQQGQSNVRNGAPQTLEIPSQQGQQGEVGQLQKARSPYVVNQGWLIPVRLITPINTDVKGPVIAEVIQPVMDSATGKHELIPVGTKILGTYSTQVFYSADRLTNTWHTMVFRNGETMDLKQMPGMDSTGTAGLNIKTNNHFWGVAGRSLLLTVTGAAGLMATQGAYDGGDLDPTDALGIEASREIRNTGRAAVSGGMHRPPTGTAQAGEVFFVQVSEPLVFPHPWNDRVEDVDYAELD